MRTLQENSLVPHSTPSVFFISKEMASHGGSRKEDNTGTWETLQPQNFKERREQKDICEEKDDDADHCFWGGYPAYPVCARGTCNVVPQGVKAAVNMAKRRKNSKNKEAAKRARKILARLTEYLDNNEGPRPE